MGAVKQWLAEIEEKTADLMVTMSGGMLGKDEALDMARDEFEQEGFDCTRFDFNALVDDAMGIREGSKRTRWLRRMYWEFDEYMRYEMWDKMTYDGIYEDDAWEVIGAFVEFCEKGYVTDEGGHPFFVGEDGCVHDYDAAVNLMDEELREELLRTMSNSTPQEFIKAYAEKHKEKFGEGFAPYDGGAW